MHVKVHEVSVDLLVDDGGGALQGHHVVLQPDLGSLLLPPFPCRDQGYEEEDFVIMPEIYLGTRNLFVRRGDVISSRQDTMSRMYGLVCLLIL